MGEQQFDDNGDPIETQTPAEQVNIKRLRDQADRVKPLETENEQLKAALADRDRRDALKDGASSIGIPDDQRETFLKLADKMVDGEPTEDALRKLAEEFKFVTPAQQQAQAAGTVAQQIASEHVGATTVVATSADEYNRQIREAKSADEVLEIARKAGRVVSSSGPSFPGPPPR